MFTLMFITYSIVGLTGWVAIETGEALMVRFRNRRRRPYSRHTF